MATLTGEFIGSNKILLLVISTLLAVFILPLLINKRKKKEHHHWLEEVHLTEKMKRVLIVAALISLGIFIVAMLIKVFSTTGLLSESTFNLLKRLFDKLLVFMKINHLLLFMVTLLVVLSSLMHYFKKKKDEIPKIKLDCLREVIPGEKFNLMFKLINGKEDVSMRIWGFLIDRRESYARKCPAPHGAIYKIDLEKYEQREIKIPMKIPENFTLGKYSIISCCEITVENFQEVKLVGGRRRVKGIIKHIDVVPRVRKKVFKGTHDILKSVVGNKNQLSQDLALRLAEQKDFNIDRMKEIELARTKAELKLKLNRYRKINKLLDKKREIDSEMKLIKGEEEIKKELLNIDYSQKMQREKNNMFRYFFNFFKSNSRDKEIKKLLKQKNKLDGKIRKNSK